MTISERLFSIMQKKDISMPELSRRTGISRHTIFDWHRRNTNPGSDKIMVLCEALEIMPEELLLGQAANEPAEEQRDISLGDFELQILEICRGFSDSKKRRLMAYMSMLQNMKE